MADLIGQSLGRYHILEQLGEDGMAIVFKAYDTRSEREVAAKVIRAENPTPGTMERALKRFEREAKSLAQLTYPNLIKVTDYGEVEGKPHPVMEYLPAGRDTQGAHQAGTASLAGGGEIITPHCAGVEICTPAESHSA